jgi:hypothetical protein
MRFAHNQTTGTVCATPKTATKQHASVSSNLPKKSLRGNQEGCKS